MGMVSCRLELEQRVKTLENELDYIRSYRIDEIGYYDKEDTIISICDELLGEDIDYE